MLRKFFTGLNCGCNFYAGIDNEGNLYHKAYGNLSNPSIYNN